MTARTPITIGLSLRKLTPKAREDVFNATVGLLKPIQSRAFEILRRKNLTNPKRVFKLSLRFLCAKSMPLTWTLPDGSVRENTAPKHATVVEQEDGTKSFKWTKWVTTPVSTSDIQNSEVLELVMPPARSEPEADESQVIINTAKDLVVQLILFLNNPKSKTTPLPMVYVPCPESLTIMDSDVTRADSGNVDICYMAAHPGYLITGFGREGSSVARRVQQRLLSCMEALTAPKTQKGREARKPPVHRSNVQWRSNVSANFDAMLAASSR